MKVPVQIEVKLPAASWGASARRRVNRTGYSVEVEPGTTLLDLLWGTLHLTGTKEGYGQGKGDDI